MSAISVRVSVPISGRGVKENNGRVMIEWVGFAGLIGAAIISGVFAVLATRYRRENGEQHHANTIRLEGVADNIVEIGKDIRSVREWQHRHLEWHAEQKV